MADNKQPTGPEEHITPEAAAPDMPGPAPAPDLTAGEAVTLEHEGKAALFEMGEALPDPGDVVVPFEKIDELIKERNAAAREAVEREEEAAPGNDDKTAGAGQQKPRRGHPPKADKAEPAAPEKTPEATKPRRGRPSQVDKAAPDGAKPPKRERFSLSRSEKACSIWPVDKAYKQSKKGAKKHLCGEPPERCRIKNGRNSRP